MGDKPAEKTPLGRQIRAKNPATVTTLKGVNRQQRRLSRRQPLAAETTEAAQARPVQGLECLPLPLLGIDLDKRVCQCNQAALDLLGGTEQTLLGTSLATLLPEFPQLEAAFEQLLSTRTRIQLGRMPWRRSEPSRLLALSLYPVAEPLAAALLYIEDVTAQAQQDEFSNQQEKMTAIGNLAAGVAHEINAPLTSILQNLQVLRNRLHPNLPKNIELALECGFDIDHLDHYIEERGIQAILSAAIAAGTKAADIAQNMLNFSHKDDCGFQPHRLSTLLDKAVELAAGNYHLHSSLDFRKIEIVRHYDQDLPPCHCNAGQLQQVFLHLLTSGAQALSKRLLFWEKHRATLPSAEKPRLILRLIKQRQSLLCEIEDNGCGMDDELRKRIFEPFAATPKTASDSGSGLGLSVCYFIICKNHNGRMSLASRLDIGSRFSLELPLQPPSETPPAAG